MQETWLAVLNNFITQLPAILIAWAGVLVAWRALSNKIDKNAHITQNKIDQNTAITLTGVSASKTAATASIVAANAATETTKAINVKVDEMVRAGYDSGLNEAKKNDL